MKDLIFKKQILLLNMACSFTKSNGEVYRFIWIVVHVIPQWDITDSEMIKSYSPTIVLLHQPV